MTRRTLRAPFLAAALAAAALAQPASRAAAEPAAEGLRTLRVGTSGDYAPFSTRTAAAPARDGTTEGHASYSGFDIDVARRFAADRGYRIELVPLRWRDLSRDIAADRFDVAMSGITMRADRSVVGRFTVPVAATQAYALTWTGCDATAPRQLNRPGRRVAVNAGGYLEGVARRLFPSAQIIAIDDNEAVRMSLLDRWTDAVITDNLEEKQWTRGVGGVIRLGPLTDDRKAYLVRADREDLAAELDDWLLAREADGWLSRLRRLRLGEVQQPAPTSPIQALATAIAERTSLMPAVWAAKQKRGLPIEDEAQQRRVVDATLTAVRNAALAASRPLPEERRVRDLATALIEVGKDVQREMQERGREPDLSDGDFDLETQLRPAIARVGAKLARLLVALDVALTAESVQRPLARALAPYPVRPEHVEAMADAIAAISRTADDGKPPLRATAVQGQGG